MVGWRQTALLAVIALAVLAALALTGAAIADDGEQPAAAPAPLQPTQVVAEIPEGYNQLFPLQWGGGSLFQLKSRLATMGCIANTIWNYDDDRWHSYNQYNVPSTLNADWLAAYGEFVPAGSLYATCFDVCEFSYFNIPRGGFSCWSLADMRESEGWTGAHKYPIDDSLECTDDFDKRVKAHVLSSMPLYPGVCIFRPSAPTAGGEVVAPFATEHWIPQRPSYVVVRRRTSPSPKGEEYYHAFDLTVEIHELCHTNQYLHFLKQMRPDRPRRVTIGSDLQVERWRMTKPGDSFIDLVGFAQDDTGDWSLPGDSTFRDIYGSDDPVELSAELCALYFVDQMGEPLVVWERDVKDFDPMRYLTDEIVEWIETWVVLPEIVEE